MNLCDTHSHLYDAAFDSDRADAVRRALDAGVGRMYLPAIDSESHGAMLSLCDAYPGHCFPMMGLHPTSVNDNPAYEEELRLVEEYLAADAAGERRFVAVGEVGLDLYWSRDWFDRQAAVFEKQIDLALQYGLPLVIHTRDAWPEMIAILRRYKGRGMTGVMHAFSGSYDDYLAVKECGDFVFGIGGVVTYKKSAIVELLPRIGLGDIVLETDAPYLTPVPYRGKRNESSYIPLICAKVAEIYGLPEEDVAEATTANALRIFGHA